MYILSKHKIQLPNSNILLRQSTCISGRFPGVYLYRTK